MHWRRKWQPTPGFLPGEPRDGEAWWAAVYGVARNRTRLKRLSSSSSSRASQRAVKNLAECRRRGLYPWVRKIPWRSTWQPTPVFLPGEFHGQKILVGYSPWGCKESDMTEHSTRTHTHVCTHIYGKKTNRIQLQTVQSLFNDEIFAFNSKLHSLLPFHTLK